MLKYGCVIRERSTLDEKNIVSFKDFENAIDKFAHRNLTFPMQ